MNKKSIKIFLIVILSWNVLHFFSDVLAVTEKELVSVKHGDGMKLLAQQNQLESDGNKLEDSFQFDLAKEKYEQAIKIGKRMTPRQDYARPTSFYIRILQKEGKYEEALEEMGRLSERVPKNEYFDNRKKELEALIKARSESDAEPVRKYIKSIKEKYAERIPPKGHWSEMEISVILRLYDTIGDYDAGLAYIDQIFDFLKQRRKEKGDKSYVLYELKTSQEAIACMNRPKPNSDLNGCRFMRDYLLVREGFERDKAEGRESCISVKPGEICMGRATKALIASDYFTW